ncbi:MAG: hypothetical protein ACO3JL_18150 [Myxococcota bacterium]
MHIWALDGLSGHVDLVEALAPRAGQDLPDLLLLFGRAAESAAAAIWAAHSEEVRERADAPVELARRYLREAGEPGFGDDIRAFPAVPPWARRARVVSHGDPGYFHPLPTAARELELVDGLVVLAVPDLGEVLADALMNATVWIGGGRPTPLLEAKNGRALLAPGDSLRARNRLECELTRARLIARVVDHTGAALSTLDLPLQRRSRMTVQG